MKTVSIMQPYFFPYIGYWQLLTAADQFIIYDNIQYTKKGWINRNRFLQNGKDQLFILPLKSDSDYLDVAQRVLSPDFNRKKLISQLSNAYRRAPFYKENFPLIEDIILFEQGNLFEYILNSVRKTADYLEMETQITVSSDVQIDHSMKAQDKVIALCKAVNADTYVNPPGGMELYSEAAFENAGLSLSFLKPDSITYQQFDNEFQAALSIIDVLMFNTRRETINLTHAYKLIKKPLEGPSALQNRE